MVLITVVDLVKRYHCHKGFMDLGELTESFQITQKRNPVTGVEC